MLYMHALNIVFCMAFVFGSIQTASMTTYNYHSSVVIMSTVFFSITNHFSTYPLSSWRKSRTKTKKPSRLLSLVSVDFNPVGEHFFFPTYNSEMQQWKSRLRTFSSLVLNGMKKRSDYDDEEFSSEHKTCSKNRNTAVELKGKTPRFRTSGFCGLHGAKMLRHSQTSKSFSWV